MQVVQRLVTLRDKLSGLDDDGETGRHATNISGGAIAAGSLIDAPAAYSGGQHRSDDRSAQRVLIAPRFRVVFTLVLVFIDIAAAATLTALFEPGTGFVISLLIVAPLMILAANLCGLYLVDSVSHVRCAARSSSAIAAISLPAAVLGGWVLGDEALGVRVALSLASGAGLVVLSRIILAMLVVRLADHLAERVLIVGHPKAVQDGFGDGRMSGWGRVVGLIAVGNGVPCLPLLGRICADSAPRFPVSYPTRGIDRVVILQAGLDDAQMAAIIKHLEALSLPVNILMTLAGHTGASGLYENVGWVVRERPMTPASMLAKRCLDLLMCGIALFVLAPLLILIGLLVRLDSPGPALFRQTRLGRGNEPFTVFKFRTMRVDAHATDGSVQAVRGDSRVTRIGAFLRKTSIDELPQLLNVLNGTMSLVGPRPHPTELNKKFMPLIDSYAARHRIAPGITGWAQVNGFRGETRTVEQMQKRVDFDLEYIRDRSVAFDLWILLRTIVSVFAHRNAAY